MADSNMQPRKLLAGGAALLILLLAAYGNHFHNSLHFDDWHTVIQSPYIRDLANIPKFFTDARTFSTLPANQSYRPIVSTSLAIDYHLARGLDTLWFHISTFFWYVVLLACMYALFARIAEPGVGLFATALYGLHPVNAETVNYVVQRGDIYSTLGAVAGLVVYIYFPGARKWGAYLIPVVIGSLAKPPALMFLPILFVYMLLFEDAPLFGAIRNCIPAGLVCFLAGLLGVVMTPKTYTTGGSDAIHYWMTQPIVILHYVKSFFLPTELSADTDRPLVQSIFSETSVIGLVFLAALAWVIVRCWRRPEMRPVTFGLLWFLIALVPTSVPALSEVENDHRMFFPFVGLTIAVCWAAKQYTERSLLLSKLAPFVCSIVLAAFAWGTHARNEVWRTEDTLWRDVTEKSPRNGRGLMNYGLTLMSRGDYPGAISYYKRAEEFTPNYATLMLNLAIAYGGIGDNAGAEAHFRRGLELAPADAQGFFFYGRWLQQQHRIPEATGLLRAAIAANASYLDPRYLLMQIYSDQGDAINLSALASETLSLSPSDKTAADFKARGIAPVSAAVNAPPPAKTAEDYLNLSMVLERAGKHLECIAAAKQALKLRPDYAEAYNNIAAGYESLERWDEAIQAAQKALELKPDFQLARNNLQFSLSQRQIRAAHPKK
jgi:tetratricopeptide (TPR) repeat protein